MGLPACAMVEGRKGGYLQGGAVLDNSSLTRGGRRVFDPAIHLPLALTPCNSSAGETSNAIAAVRPPDRLAPLNHLPYLMSPYGDPLGMFCKSATIRDG